MPKIVIDIDSDEPESDDDSDDDSSDSIAFDDDSDHDDFGCYKKVKLIQNDICMILVCLYDIFSALMYSIIFLLSCACLCM